MFILPEEKVIGFSPVLFHQHSPLHIWKVPNIFVKLNSMQCKQGDFVRRKKNVDFKLFVVWVRRVSDYVFESKSVQSRQFQRLALFSTAHEPI